MLQFITNSDSPRGIIAQAQAAIAGGCRWVQLRMKDSKAKDVAAVARKLKDICAASDCILVVDDLVDVAKEVGLNGVHLGKNDMPPMKARMELGAEAIIGVTANTYEDIVRYSRMDIDYIGLGPFRFTSTKKNLSPVLGIDGYSKIMSQCFANKIRIPTVAIGGITQHDIAAIMATGVHGIAVSGAVINATDPSQATREMIKQLDEILQQRLNKLP